MAFSTSMSVAFAVIALVSAQDTVSAPKGLDARVKSAQQCKAMCHRFGMKALGEAFVAITNPVICCTKCDEVFAAASAPKVSLLGVSQPGAPAGVDPHVKDAHQCKTMCHRFGMKALGAAFVAITNPVICCDKCDEVFAAASAPKVSLLEISQPTAPAGVDPHVKDAHQCKTMCHRFGMKALGAAFVAITNPVICCDKCDEVFAAASAPKVSLLEVSQPAAPAGLDPRVKDSHQCKAMCHRFGMKALGSAFVAITNPVICCDKCDEVFAAAPAAPKPKVSLLRLSSVSAHKAGTGDAVVRGD